jgi:hypothetical protein
VAYDDLLDLLKLHLRREVVEVIPVAAKVITGKEWDDMAKASQGEIPVTRQPPLMGYFIAGSPRELVAPVIAGMPTPLKLLYPLVGKRRFERQYRELFPGGRCRRLCSHRPGASRQRSVQDPRRRGAAVCPSS